MNPLNYKKFRACSGQTDRLWFKAAASFVVFTFLMTQISWAQDGKPFELTPNAQTVKTISSQDFSYQTHAAAETLQQTSVDFMKDTLTLGSVDDQQPLKPRDENKALTENKTNEGYEADRYEFKDALELIRPEFAAAIPVRSVAFA